MDLIETMEQYFGHRTFRDGQEQVIRALLNGKSALAIFPTGGGKSLCYQLPALLLDGVTLVISPLIALMKDQVQALCRKGIAAARLDSTLTLAEMDHVYAELAAGNLKLLYIAPERLANETFMKRLKKTKIALLAIDESHCISEWGHNFRPDYLRLTAIARKMKLRPILALTATATPRVAEEIATAFKIAKANRVQNSFHRPNLALHITPCPAAERLDLLTTKLVEERRFPAIVYVTQQQTAEHVATHLARQGLKAQAYHAGLEDEHRSSVQDAFMQGTTEVIVATIAFGMGIDKADIRAVYHYNLPKTLENYQQEVGRAGRDGNASHCELLACQDDLIVLQNFIYGDTPTRTALRHVLDHLLRQGRDLAISHWDLSRATDVRAMVLETVITYLENEGVLEPTGSFYNQFQIAFTPNQQRVLAGYPAKEQAFLRTLFDSGKQGWKWVTLKVDAAMEATGATRERIVRTLREMEQTGEVELRASHIRYKYRLTSDLAAHDPEAICTRMQALFAEREANDIARLEQVLELTQDHRCLVKNILAYFGEKLKSPCGTCSSCQEKRRRPRVIPRSPTPGITAAQLADVRAVIAEKHPALRNPKALARFLCGINSPAITRDRLTRNNAFGMLSTIPFNDVLIQTQSMVLL